MILRHIEEKSENTCGFSVSSEPIDTESKLGSDGDPCQRLTYIAALLVLLSILPLRTQTYLMLSSSYPDLSIMSCHSYLDLSWAQAHPLYYTRMDLDFAADGNLRELSGEEAWEAIENFAQGQKEWDNPPNIISEQEVANLKAQAKRLFGNEDVWVEMHREEVEETLETPVEVEPLDETQLEDLGLNTCNHDIPLSNREVPSFDEPEPQPNPLPNCLSLDVSLGEERGPEPPIKPHSLDSFRMKEVDSLTINTPPSPHVASSHPKDTKGLESRQKPSNPCKKSNFVGRVKGLKVFIGNFTYGCNFMILEDTTSIIDHHLGEVVFGKPFARNTGLVYDQEEGTITFEKDDEEITFKMPHKMETSNHIDFKNINTDSIPPFVLGSNGARRTTYYSYSLTLGSEYKDDEGISKEIQHLMKLEREAKRHKGEVT
ncbi:protein kinase-like domain, concanavalin A-like lectin/glucanase domain protein [Tanacetum coccineum]